MGLFTNTIQKCIPNNSPDRFKLIYLTLAFLCLVVVLTLSITVVKNLSTRHMVYEIETSSEKIADALIYTEVEAITIKEEHGSVELGVSKDFFPALDARIRDIFDQLQILKIVIYNKNGRVIYSTDKHLVDAIENENILLKMTLDGSKQLVIRNNHSSVDMVGEKRLDADIAEVYIPVLHKGNSVIGAVAVHSDVSNQKKVYQSQLLFSIYILTGAILLVSIMSYFVILRASSELKKAYNLLEVYAETDALTGVYNRGELMRRAEEFFVIMQRSREKLTAGVGIGIVMIDLDYFKQVNDDYGHLVGDSVLRDAAGRIADILRSYDVLGRYGGEEFLIILPNTTAEEVSIITERAMSSISSKPIQVGELSISITASFGATWGDAVKENLDSVIRRADELLYEAKNGGRNRVVFRI